VGWGVAYMHPPGCANFDKVLLSYGAKCKKARNFMVWSWFGPTTCKIDFTLGFCME
jgi:hypothetical protein